MTAGPCVEELALFQLPPVARVRRGLAPERRSAHTVNRPPRNAPTSHPCPSPGCRIWVPIHRLACSDHWFSLPEDLRTAINATYRKDRRRHLQLFREAVGLLHTNALREDPR